MQTKTKQRLVGLLILLAILAIFLPLLFHNSHPSTEISSVAIPPKPKMDTLAVKTEQKETVELSPLPVVPAPTPQATRKPATTMAIQPKAETPVPAVAMKQIPEKTTVQITKTHLQKDKAWATSEQKGLNKFIEVPRAWSVQLGTFGNIENANRLIVQLRKKGFDAYTRPILNAKGNRLLRVYVGPEIQKESALQLKNKLEANFHLKGVIRKYKVKT